MSSNVIKNIPRILPKKNRASSTLSAFGLLSAMAVGMINPAQAEITPKEVEKYAAAMTAAANAKSMTRVGNLVAEDALIAVSRKGKSSTLNKSNYLNLLQNNWSKASQYGYNIQINNIVISGTQAKADAVTTEVIVENEITTRLVTTSRITLTESANALVLSRAISQLVIEKH